MTSANQIRVVFTWKKAPYNDTLYSYFIGHDSSNNEFNIGSYICDSRFPWEMVNHGGGPQALLIDKTQLKNGVFVIQDSANMELDGQPGLEKLWQIVTLSPYRQILRVISGSDESYRDFHISSFSQYSYFECFDFNGNPGNEIMVKDTWAGLLGVISYCDNTVHTYTVDYDLNWNAYSYGDTDGEPGM